MNDKIILVTGSNGYIGQHLVKKLGMVDSLDIEGTPTYLIDIRNNVDKINLPSPTNIVVKKGQERSCHVNTDRKYQLLFKQLFGFYQ